MVETLDDWGENCVPRASTGTSSRQPILDSLRIRVDGGDGSLGPKGSQLSGRESTSAHFFAVALMMVGKLQLSMTLLIGGSINIGRSGHAGSKWIDALLEFHGGPNVRGGGKEGRRVNMPANWTDRHEK